MFSGFATSGGVARFVVSMYRVKIEWLLFSCTSTLPMYCASSVGRVRSYWTRPHSSCGFGRKEEIFSAAGLSADDAMRLLTKPPRITTGLRPHVRELNVEKSPASIAAVGTNASKSEGVLRNWEPW